MMMFLIKRSEYDDDVVVDRKAKVLKKTVADRKVKELKMLLLIEVVKVVAGRSSQSVDIAED